MDKRRWKRFPAILPRKVSMLDSKGRDWSSTMTVKEKMLNALESLPADATIEDAMERLLLLAKIERGLAQADRGETISHAEVRERMAKWQK